MNNIINPAKFMIGALWWAILLASAGAAPSASGKDADEAVRQVSRNVFDNLEALQKLHESDQDAYYTRVGELVNDHIDYKRMARGVMGRRHYQAASPEQRERFIGVFQDSMVATYARVALVLDSASLEWQVKEPQMRGKSALVQQTVSSADGSNDIAYSLYKNDDGKWMMFNVVLDGINLGRSFRDQFARAMAAADGDMDQVIDGWNIDDSG